MKIRVAMTLHGSSNYLEHRDSMVRYQGKAISADYAEWSASFMKCHVLCWISAFSTCVQQWSMSSECPNHLRLLPYCLLLALQTLHCRYHRLSEADKLTVSRALACKKGKRKR